MRPFGPWLRAGGGRPRLSLGSKWLVNDGGAGRSLMGVQKYLNEKQDQGQISGQLKIQEKGEGLNPEGARTAGNGVGEQKRRRTWDALEQEQSGEEAMVLDSTKNREGAAWVPQTRLN
ncbi:unnamed protein product [Cuscuta epithymum]|nr:unnamed protein product [Cuscuta epithymum]